MHRYFKLVAVLLVVVNGVIKAQLNSDTLFLKEQVEQQQQSVNALVLYPKEIRQIIFEACTYPQLLLSLDRIQKSSRDSFRQVTHAYSEPVKEAIWDACRYPGLLEQLASNQNLIEHELHTKLDAFPEEIHERATYLYFHYPQLITKVADVLQQTNILANQYLSELPDTLQNTFQCLINLPEILEVMVHHIEMTIAVGEVYRSTPEWIILKTDSLSKVVSQNNLIEMMDWKASIECNPKALQQMQAATQAYEAAYGYDDIYYDYESDDECYDEIDPEVMIYHHLDYYYHFHYPYWVGYPNWYSYPRWRPYPLWRDWGYYIQPGGRFVFTNLPTPHFTKWYFNTPHHHYQYPFFSDLLVQHYFDHPTAFSGLVSHVVQWQQLHAQLLPITELSLKIDRVARLKEFGQLETERIRYNLYHQNKLSPLEYLKRNRQQYPILSRKTTYRLYKDDKKEQALQDLISSIHKIKSIRIK